jgi:hypothetical protein
MSITPLSFPEECLTQIGKRELIKKPMIKWLSPATIKTSSELIRLGGKTSIAKYF